MSCVTKGDLDWKSNLSLRYVNVIHGVGVLSITIVTSNSPFDMSTMVVHVPRDTVCNGVFVLMSYLRHASLLLITS